MANKTLDGKFLYHEIVKGKTFSEWVQDLHRYNCEKSGWNFSPLKPGSYGFDNLVWVLAYCTKKNDFSPQAVHHAWCRNYVYWRDNFEHQTGYNKPFNPLGDKRRNDCSITPYVDLPSEEKKKDIIISEFLEKTFS